VPFLEMQVIRRVMAQKKGETINEILDVKCCKPLCTLFIIDFLHLVFIRFLMWHNENNYHLFIICVVDIFSETISHLWSSRKGSILFRIISGG